MMATKTVPHYKASQQRAQVWAFSSTIFLSFITGAMLGACIAIGWIG